MTDKLSVIIPFCNEYPQVVFTVQSIYNELYNARFPWEVIIINNYCQEVSQQPIGEWECPSCKSKMRKFRTEDKSASKMLSYSKIHFWLTYVEYKEKLSHWQAKNTGVEASSGDVLWFCDAHCSVVPGSLKGMMRVYTENKKQINGSLHLPLTYILDRLDRRLIYKPVCNPEKGLYHYSFTRYRDAVTFYKVAAMSTCGMMISREIFDLLGGWPSELGIYGGGENFINYTLAVLGKNKMILPGPPLIHFADKRGYSYNASDYIRNRLIATYLFGGPPLLNLYSQHTKGRPTVIEQYKEDILNKCASHRAHIAKNQKISVTDWYYQFTKESKNG